MFKAKWLALAGGLLLAVNGGTAEQDVRTTAAAGPGGKGEGYPQGYRLVHDWPQRPIRFILGQVSGLGVNSKGEVLALHRADRFWTGGESYDSPIARPAILKISGATGERLGALGAGQFFMPHGLSVDHEDNIWVTDVALHQVFKLSPEGELLMALGERGKAGDDARRFDMPTDAAVAGTATFTYPTATATAASPSSPPMASFCSTGALKARAPGSSMCRTASLWTPNSEYMWRTEATSGCRYSIGTAPF